MRLRALLTVLSAGVALLATPACAGQLESADEVRQAGEALLARMRDGQLTPEQAAADAARRGDFRMFRVDYVRGGDYLPGVACATPFGQPPSSLMTQMRGDAVIIPDPPRDQFDALTPRYNRALVSAPEFPYPDLCAPAERTGARPSYAQALRRPSGPPRDLWAAARYGKPVEVRRFLRSTPIDQDDAFGMTALAWATARGRADIVRLLLAAGADPMPSSNKLGELTSPVFVAVTTDRPALLDPLLRARKATEPWRWRHFYVDAAVATGDAALLRRILSEPHDYPGDMYLPPDVPADIAEVLVRAPDKALGKAVILVGAANGRPELVRLALEHGVSPDTARSSETALALAASGLRGEADVESVRLLIAAGADVNLRRDNQAWGETPVWDVAAGFMSYRKATWSSQEKILLMLLDAGADLKPVSRKGVPLIWRLLFSPHVKQDEIGSAPPPRIIALLAARGMDVNAPWNGRTPLDWVDEALGPTSEMATTLRAAGAVNSKR